MSIRSILPAVALAILPSCSDSSNHSTAPDPNGKATVRLANAIDTKLDLRQNDSVVSGGGSLGFGAMSPCTRVSAADPSLVVARMGTTENLAGFDPSFDAGKSYTLVAFPGGGTATSFAMLLNAFTPASNAAGFRVMNATSGTTALDAFVTTPNAPLISPTTSNTAAGTASALVNTGAGTRQIRITVAGSHTVLLDFGSRSLSSRTNYTLVVAPSSSGTTLRAFLVAGC